MQNPVYKTTIVEINPRLHITLIGMNRTGYRINGGVGFSLSEPSMKIKAVISKTISLIDLRDFPFSPKELRRIKEVISMEKKRLKFSHNVNIEISGAMPTHFGFGSSTATRLACLEALHILNGNKPKKNQLITASGRGGTSGIGVNTYFEGGFVVDLGRKAKNYFYLPSQLTEKRSEMPLLMQRLDMPNWDIGVCIPNKIQEKSEKEEVEFFKKTCPISPANVNKILYNVIYGLYAAVREHSKYTFCLAIREIQKCEWKQAERRQYGNSLLKVEQQLYSCGAHAVGMSSLGPSIFFLADNINSVIEKIKIENVNCRIFIARPSNKGRIIING